MSICRRWSMSPMPSCSAGAATSNHSSRYDVTQSGQPQTAKIAREIFGHLPDGTAIEMVRLRGDNGFEVRLITYGAALQSIFAPDRAGRLADVVLGRDDLARLSRGPALPRRHGRALRQPDRGRHVRTGWRALSSCRPMTAPTRCMAGCQASIASHGPSRPSVKTRRLSSRCPMSVRMARRAIPAH